MIKFIRSTLLLAGLALLSRQNSSSHQACRYSETDVDKEFACFRYSSSVRPQPQNTESVALFSIQNNSRNQYWMCANPFTGQWLADVRHQRQNTGVLVRWKQSFGWDYTPVMRCSSISSKFSESPKVELSATFGSGVTYSVLCVQHSQQPRWNFAVHSCTKVIEVEMFRSNTIRRLSSICVQHSQQPRWDFAAHRFFEMTETFRATTSRWLSSIFSKNDYAQGKHTRDLLEHRGKYLKIA